MYPAIDYINHLENNQASMRNELVDLRARDAERQSQLEKLSQQVSIVQQDRRGQYDANAGPGFSTHFQQPSSDSPRKLPPLVNGNANAGASAMQGVQYSDERR